MSRSRTPLQAAAGKLIAAIQKEWTAEVGEPHSAATEEVMHASHCLLQAASKFGSIASVLGNDSIAGFLGEEWVKAHPAVWPFIEAVEACVDH